MRILYVEDDDWIRHAVLLMLRSSGHQVRHADDCSAALTIVEEGSDRFDMLISDIDTPGEIDGWHLAEVVRSFWPKIPVIYSTGSPMERARPVAGGLILRKPFSQAALLEKIAEAQASARRARQIVLPAAASRSGLRARDDRALGYPPAEPGRTAPALGGSRSAAW